MSSRRLRLLSLQAMLFVLLITIGCSWRQASGKDIPMSNGPLRLVYTWNTGSIPPPDYYEYEISAGPGQTGEIRLCPDYPGSGAPCWKESFKIATSSYKDLLRCLQQTAALQNGASSIPTVGGSYERLLIWREGHEPVDLAVASEYGRRAVEIIKGLVPKDSWHRLLNKLEAYRENRR